MVLYSVGNDLTWIDMGQVNYTYDAARGRIPARLELSNKFLKSFEFLNRILLWNVTVQKFNLMDKESPNELQLEEFLMIEMFQMI